MVKPIEIITKADVWTLISSDVTSDYIYLGNKRPNIYLWTYRIAGDPAPIDKVDAVPVQYPGLPISAVSGIDVYIMSVGSNGSVFFGTDIDPSLIFSLKTSLLSDNVNYTLELNRDTTGTVIDFEGVLHTAKIDEARFSGARRVENLCTDSETYATETITVHSGIDYIFSFSGTGSVTFSGAATGTLAGTGSDRVEVTKTTSSTSLTITVTGAVLQALLEQKSGSQTVASEYVSTGVSVRTGEELVTNGGFDTDLSNWNAANWVWEAGKAKAISGFTNSLVQNILTIGKSYRVEYTVSGRTAGSCRARLGSAYSSSNRTTNGTFIEVGICVGNTELLISRDSSFNGYIDNVSVKEEYFHGANVDGVKYFNTNRSGSIIPDATLLGYLNEPEAINLFLNSTAPATQIITVVSGIDYCVSVTGTGNIVLSGAGTGTVTDGSYVTFTASTTSLTCTVTGLDTVQVETGKFQTSYIKTEATTVTRTADNLTVDNSNRDVLPNSFCLVGTWSPLGDGSDYETTDCRLFGTQDSRGNAYEVTVIGGTSYDYTPGTGGGVFTIDQADINQLTENKYAFQLFQDGPNVSAKIYKDGVQKLIETETQTLDHSNTSLEIASLAGVVFASNIKDVKIYNEEILDSQLKRITL